MKMYMLSTISAYNNNGVEVYGNWLLDTTAAKDEGREIIQKINSAPGIAIGGAQLSGVEFEGTMYIGCCSDNDWVGAIFAFQVIQ